METEAPNTSPAGEAPLDDASAAGGNDVAAAELAAAKALAEERYRDLQYARAEIDNVRKRAERIAADRLSAGRRSLLGKFLQCLESEQVRAIEVVGKPFDPRLAEAIATRETNDVEDDVVVEEAQRGYSLGEELLRPALVVVAKKV